MHMYSAEASHDFATDCLDRSSNGDFEELRRLDSVTKGCGVSVPFRLRMQARPDISFYGLTPGHGDLHMGKLLARDIHMSPC